MSKRKKRPFDVPQRAESSKESRQRDAQKEAKNKEEGKTNFFNDRGVRETIESIVVAVMLALIFRTYEAEAFVIPTGSMAPTLQGRHLETVCDKCGYRYITGASNENPGERNDGFIFDTVCPICRYEQTHKRKTSGFRTNEDSFTGDRILVSKFAYDLSEPQRWDVIVFKFPGNAKQNYIKRLIGLPNETVLLINGDIYVSRNDEPAEIARKPPDKLKAMLQLVDDTNFVAAQLKAAGWPSRWQEWDAPADNRTWTVSETDKPVFTAAKADQEAWLRYRHIIPRSEEWSDIERGNLPVRLQDFQGELITDYYAYNDAAPGARPGDSRFRKSDKNEFGDHWVGDLAVEADLKIESDSGQVGFDLVEGGTHFTCWIDVATGKATISSDDLAIVFGGSSGNPNPVAETRIKKPGNYDVRFANVDNELTLWINNKVVMFDVPLTYIREEVLTPKWSKNDPGDAEPIGIGSRGAKISVSRIKLLRDVYYVANQSDVRLHSFADDPTSWEKPASIELIQISAVGDAEPFKLLEDQFMPLGDNSPSSLDARVWKHVDRSMLTGQALYIYWPHAWRPFWPNFRRMGFIH